MNNEQHFPDEQPSTEKKEIVSHSQFVNHDGELRAPEFHWFDAGDGSPFVLDHVVMKDEHGKTLWTEKPDVHAINRLSSFDAHKLNFLSDMTEDEVRRFFRNLYGDGASPEV